MLYGAYKTARDAAWRCLIDYGVVELPIDLLAITRSAGAKFIKTYDNKEGFLRGNEIGVCYYRNGKWYIVIDGNQPRGRRCFTIAHELGHIFLGHLMRDGKHGREFDTSKPLIESEADMFAARLLAPACVLWGLGLETPQEIADACWISMQAATIRAERMAELRKRGKFLTHPLERKVYEQFEPWIESELERRKG